MENVNIDVVSTNIDETITVTVEETVEDNSVDSVDTEVTFTEAELSEIEDVLINGTDEFLLPPEAIIGLDEGIPGGDSSPISEEDKMDLIAKLEELQKELEETEDDMFEQKLAAESAAMDTYIDGMFHMSEIQSLLQDSAANIFSSEVTEKFDKLLFKMRSLISRERNKFNKNLVKQNLPKKDREQMLKLFFNQTKTLREDITKLS